jgi:hypothetical protein
MGNRSAAPVGIMPDLAFHDIREIPKRLAGNQIGGIKNIILRVNTELYVAKIINPEKYSD